MKRRKFTVEVSMLDGANQADVDYLADSMQKILAVTHPNRLAVVTSKPLEEPLADWEMELLQSGDIERRRSELERRVQEAKDCLDKLRKLRTFVTPVDKVLATTNALQAVSMMEYDLEEFNERNPKE